MTLMPLIQTPLKDSQRGKVCFTYLNEDTHVTFIDPLLRPDWVTN